MNKYLVTTILAGCAFAPIIHVSADTTVDTTLWNGVVSFYDRLNDVHNATLQAPTTINNLSQRLAPLLNTPASRSAELDVLFDDVHSCFNTLNNNIAQSQADFDDISHRTDLEIRDLQNQLNSLISSTNGQINALNNEIIDLNNQIAQIQNALATLASMSDEKTAIIVNMLNVIAANYAQAAAQRSVFVGQLNSFLAALNAYNQHTMASCDQITHDLISSN